MLWSDVRRYERANRLLHFRNISSVKFNMTARGSNPGQSSIVDGMLRPPESNTSFELGIVTPAGGRGSFEP